MCFWRRSCEPWPAAAGGFNYTDFEGRHPAGEIGLHAARPGSVL